MLRISGVVIRGIFHAKNIRVEMPRISSVVIRGISTLIFI